MTNSRPLQVLENFNRYPGQICISTITLTELIHGVEKSNGPGHNLRVLQDFIGRLTVLEFGIEAAGHYGNIRTVLERMGTPISVNDLYIASHARSEALTLVTNNTKEFQRIEGLRLENWI